MGMLDRYKKKGGFIQLLNLLETSNKTKQDQFLKLIEEESTVWEKELRKKILTIDKIVSWEKQHLSEVITRIQPLTLTVALRHFNEDQKEYVLNILSQSEKRKIQNLITETNPTPSEVLTCINKIISEVRGLVQQNIIKLEKVAPDLHIPENIEEQLYQKSQSAYYETSMVDSEKKNSNDFASANQDSKNNSQEEVVLDFSGASRNKNATLTNPSTNVSALNSDRSERADKVDSLKDELDFLRKKVNQLTQEIAQLKQENAVYRTKLEQIKKIA